VKVSDSDLKKVCPPIQVLFFSHRQTDRLQRMPNYSVIRGYIAGATDRTSLYKQTAQESVGPELYF